MPEPRAPQRERVDQRLAEDDRLTAEHQAKDHFPESADYHAFCETFGPPPGA